MSSAPDPPEREDPLLRALRELPSPSLDGTRDARVRREARAAFVRSFDGAPLHVRVLGGASRAMVPVVLAGVVGIYMTWAIGTAASLFH